MIGVATALVEELPPRARRILFSAASSLFVLGTTSACAENTHQTTFLVAGTRNYLRVRGEYQRMNDTNHDLRELPPRARRIPCHRFPAPQRLGTTSACAENTWW